MGPWWGSAWSLGHWLTHHIGIGVRVRWHTHSMLWGPLLSHHHIRWGHAHEMLWGKHLTWHTKWWCHLLLEMIRRRAHTRISILHLLHHLHLLLHFLCLLLLLPSLRKSLIICFKIFPMLPTCQVNDVQCS